MGENVEVVEVVYENGVLKLFKLLKLKEGEYLVIKFYRKDIVEKMEKFRKIIFFENFKESFEEYF